MVVALLERVCKINRYCIIDKCMHTYCTGAKLGCGYGSRSQKWVGASRFTLTGFYGLCMNRDITPQGH